MPSERDTSDDREDVREKTISTKVLRTMTDTVSVTRDGRALFTYGGPCPSIGRVAKSLNRLAILARAEQLQPPQLRSMSWVSSLAVSPTCTRTGS